MGVWVLSVQGIRAFGEQPLLANMYVLCVCSSCTCIKRYVLSLSVYNVASFSRNEIGVGLAGPTAPFQGAPGPRPGQVCRTASQAKGLLNNRQPRNPNFQIPMQACKDPTNPIYAN